MKVQSSPTRYSTSLGSVGVLLATHGVSGTISKISQFIIQQNPASWHHHCRTHVLFDGGGETDHVLMLIDD